MIGKVSPLVCGAVLLVFGSLHAQQKPAIEVASATYGLNVSESALGNATKYVKSACDGKRSCHFAIKNAAATIAERTSRKSNDFDVVYHGENVKKGHINGDATDKIILLTCTD